MDIDLKIALKAKELAEKELACNGVQECIDKVKNEAEEAKNIAIDLKEGAEDLLNGDLSGAAEELKEAAAKTGSKEAIEFADATDKAEDVVSETIKDFKSGNWGDMAGNFANFTAVLPALIETGTKLLGKAQGAFEGFKEFFKGVYNEFFSSSSSDNNIISEPAVELHASDDSHQPMPDSVEA